MVTGSPLRNKALIIYDDELQIITLKYWHTYILQMVAKHHFLSALILIFQITIGKPIGLDKIYEVTEKPTETIQLCVDILSGLLGKNQMDNWGKSSVQSNSVSKIIFFLLITNHKKFDYISLRKFHKLRKRRWE